MTRSSHTHAPRRFHRARLLSATLALAVATAGLLAASGASAAPTTQKAQARSGVVLRFGYGGGARVHEGTVVKNLAGKGRGVVHLADGARMKRVKGRPGKAMKFPRSGNGLIEAADRVAWDPRRRAFTYGTKVKMADAQVTQHSNVMQKGYYKQPGGQWKLQVDRGRPSCVVNGSEGRVLTRSGQSIADGHWHSLACRRTSDGVTLRVDGTVAASTNGATGKVSNASAVRIGAKKIGSVRVEQFRGRLDATFLRMG